MMKLAAPVRTILDIPPHPAPYSPEILPVLADVLLKQYANVRSTAHPIRVLDPFAGIGRIHQVGFLVREGGVHCVTTGVELLPRYAAAWPGTIVGDATKLPTDWTRRFDAVVTSPCYANRMADHHQNRDKCKACKGSGREGEDRGDGYVKDDRGSVIPIEFAIKCKKCRGSGLSHRRSYFHYHGEDGWIWENNAGAMAWGDEYRDLHEAAWAEARRVLKPGTATRPALLVVNLKNFTRTRKVRGEKITETIDVAGWHRRTIERIGFERLETITVKTKGYRNGTNRDARQPGERIYVFRKVGR